MDTRILDTGDAAIVYDVAGPLPPADGRPPLLMVGQPMDAGGFRTLASRTSLALAAALGQQATEFPSHHGGFMGGDGPYSGQPETFARQLRAVLDASGR